MQYRRLTIMFLGSILVGALVLPMTTQAANAIDRREARQRQRIQQGIAEGSLTRREAWRLRQEHRRIRALERRFLADGRLDPRERRILHREMDRSSRQIARLRHNHRYRY